MWQGALAVGSRKRRSPHWVIYYSTQPKRVDAADDPYPCCWTEIRYLSEKSRKKTVLLEDYTPVRIDVAPVDVETRKLGAVVRGFDFPRFKWTSSMLLGEPVAEFQLEPRSTARVLVRIMDALMDCRVKHIKDSVVEPLRVFTSALTEIDVGGFCVAASMSVRGMLNSFEAIIPHPPKTIILREHAQYLAERLEEYEDAKAAMKDHDRRHPKTRDHQPIRRENFDGSETVSLDHISDDLLHDPERKGAVSPRHLQAKLSRIGVRVIFDSGNRPRVSLNDYLTCRSKLLLHGNDRRLTS